MHELLGIHASMYAEKIENWEDFRINGALLYTLLKLDFIECKVYFDIFFKVSRFQFPNSKLIKIRNICGKWISLKQKKNIKRLLIEKDHQIFYSN